MTNVKKERFDSIDQRKQVAENSFVLRQQFQIGYEDQSDVGKPLARFAKQLEHFGIQITKYDI